MDRSQVDAFGAALAAAGARVVPAAGKAVQSTAGAVRATAQAAAPVRLGELRDSIRVLGAGLSAVVEATAPHAPYVEYGTSRMAPQPFMAPAADTGEAALASALEAVAEQALPQ